MEKIIIAPDSFKGSLTAIEACEIIYDVIGKYLPDCTVIKMPVSDGGDGLLDVLLYNLGGAKKKIFVKDPLFRDIEASYAILTDGTAVIEMASASGLLLLSPEEKNPLRTSTYGTGQLIKHAIKNGCKRIILGLGGSATTDGGAGMAAALGIHYLTSDGQTILTGQGLNSLDRIDMSGVLNDLENVEIKIACDVNNLLHGKSGAACVFGPQKGAKKTDIIQLDSGLIRLASVIKMQSKIDVQVPGAGAAGGLAVPFFLLNNSKIISGSGLVLDLIGFEKQLVGCDLVLTGEGKTDIQSSMGKIISQVGERASKVHVPVVVISGSLANGCEKLLDFGITAMFSITPAFSTLEEALRNADSNLRFVVSNIFALLGL